VGAGVPLMRALSYQPSAFSRPGSDPTAGLPHPSFWWVTGAASSDFVGHGRKPGRHLRCPLPPSNGVKGGAARLSYTVVSKGWATRSPEKCTSPSSRVLRERRTLHPQDDKADGRALTRRALLGGTAEGDCPHASRASPSTRGRLAREHPRASLSKIGRD
jgi:hypothetical protein